MRLPGSRQPQQNEDPGSWRRRTRRCVARLLNSVRKVRGRPKSKHTTLPRDAYQYPLKPTSSPQRLRRPEGRGKQGPGGRTDGRWRLLEESILVRASCQEVLFDSVKFSAADLPRIFSAMVHGGEDVSCWSAPGWSETSGESCRNA